MTDFLQIEWGKITTSNKLVFKDCICKGYVCTEWNWKITGTKHDPGIQIADLNYSTDVAIDNKTNHLVLSRGYDMCLLVGQTTINYAKSKGITVHVLESSRAIKKYNELLKENKGNEKSILGLFHSTC